MLEFWKEGTLPHKMFQPINFKTIAARKAAFLDNKQEGGSSSKRVLHELVEGLQEMMDMDNSDKEDSAVTAFLKIPQKL